MSIFGTTSGDGDASARAGAPLSAPLLGAPDVCLCTRGDEPAAVGLDAGGRAGGQGRRLSWGEGGRPERCRIIERPPRWREGAVLPEDAADVCRVLLGAVLKLDSVGLSDRQGASIPMASVSRQGQSHPANAESGVQDRRILGVRGPVRADTGSQGFRTSGHWDSGVQCGRILGGTGGFFF